MSLKKIAFIGTYVPRQCGIATFTNDLYQAIASQHRDIGYMVLPMSDRDHAYQYPSEARFEIGEQSLESYLRAADFLNINNVDLVSLQHEFGIFGGPAGSHILALLRQLRMPVVTTLHTVFKRPKEIHRKIIQEIVQLSDRVVVMAHKGKQFLMETYGVPEGKIDLIPHGIHDVPFVDPNFYKDQFGVQGKTVILTFGLLGPNKGIEHVIEALPAVLQEFPNTVYIVLGATHPYELQLNGESYRMFLERLAKEKGVQHNVIFYNRYVTLEELKEFIGAADIYVTPYLNRDQITSGTLAYTVGAGKAVLSTPYYYAEELLADGRGILVPFADSRSLSESLLRILKDEPGRHAMRKRAYQAGREMTWSKVADAYMESFLKVRQATPEDLPRRAFAEGTLKKVPNQLPPLKLDHLFTLTDRTGILHSAIYNIPDFNGGYTTDDNALGFVLATLLKEVGEENAERLHELASVYLAFLWHSFDPATGRFRACLGYDRRWRDELGSDDTQARALWALGTAIGRSQEMEFQALAEQLFERALPAVNQFTSARAWAHSLVGIHEYLHQFMGDRAAYALRDCLVKKLMQLYWQHRKPDWVWFEDQLTYENARLSHALILSGQQIGQREVLQAGLDSLRWLLQQQTSPSGCFSPIGDQGYYPRGGKKARFKQFPNEAYVTLAACMEAYRATNEEFWYQEGRRVFDWFLGRNDLNTALHDSRSGGCRDFISAQQVSPNQGAEASLAFYLALVEMRLSEGLMRVGPDVLKAAQEQELSTEDAGLISGSAHSQFAMEGTGQTNAYEKRLDSDPTSRSAAHAG